MKMNMEVIKLPGLNCGICGSKTCSEFSKAVERNPELIKRCLHLTNPPANTRTVSPDIEDAGSALSSPCSSACHSCEKAIPSNDSWIDSLGRDFDFILDMIPGEPGPRETILPHNPMITRELKIQPGDILLGRPLGMSCGCPVTHCGVVMESDMKSGVITWCVTGPLSARRNSCKDLGYYSALAYDGIVLRSKSELKIGCRYWFMPKKCMLQWRHSGLVNFLKQTPQGLQVHVEGLMIG